MFSLLDLNNKTSSNLVSEEQQIETPNFQFKYTKKRKFSNFQSNTKKRKFSNFQSKPLISILKRKHSEVTSINFYFDCKDCDVVVRRDLSPAYQ